jgi:hypothetical protein
MQNTIMHPSDRQLTTSALKYLANCPVKDRDVTIATVIFGHNLGSLKGKILGNEVERVSCRVLDCVGPYRSFVESEQERISTLRDRCDSLASIATNLRSRVGRLS